jgi:hypothetical protein
MKNFFRISIAAVSALALSSVVATQASAAISINLVTDAGGGYNPGGFEFTVPGDPIPTPAGAIFDTFQLATAPGGVPGVSGLISVSQTYSPNLPSPTTTAGSNTSQVDLRNETGVTITGRITVEFSFSNALIASFPGPALFTFTGSSNQADASTFVSGTTHVVPSSDLVFTTPLGPLSIDGDIKVLDNPVDPLDDFAFINVNTAPFTIVQTFDFELASGAKMQFNYTSTLDASPGALLGLPEPASIVAWSVISGFGAIAGWRRSRRKS